MKVRCKTGRACEAEINDFIRKQVGFYGRNSETINAFNLVECLSEFKEIFFATLSEVSDIDSC
jgi:hypothetical protein